MSIIFQYFVIRKLILTTQSTIQTPSEFKLPYSELHVFSVLWRIPFIKTILNKRQWNTCCILFHTGFVEMSHGAEWYIKISEKGALYAIELKLQIIKSIFTVLLSVFSALLGFWLGRL